MAYTPKPGDRIRAEIIVKQYGGQDSSLSFEILIDTIELIAPAVTPGQKAYDKFRATYEGDTLSWATLLDHERAMWEAVADAARS